MFVCIQYTKAKDMANHNCFRWNSKEREFVPRESKHKTLLKTPQNTSPTFIRTPEIHRPFGIPFIKHKSCEKEAQSNKSLPRSFPWTINQKKAHSHLPILFFYSKYSSYGTYLNYCEHLTTGNRKRDIRSIFFIFWKNRGNIFGSSQSGTAHLFWSHIL